LHVGYSGYGYRIFKGMTPEHMKLRLGQFAVMFVTEVIINVALMDLWFKMRLGPVGCVWGASRDSSRATSSIFFLTCSLSVMES